MDRDLPYAGFAGVVLAAGPSTRMGRNKLLMEIAGRPMIRHVVETVRSCVETVIVVTGPQRELVCEALARLPVRCVEAEGPDQADSIRTGLAAVDGTHAALVCVGDQPRLTQREIVALLDGFAPPHQDSVLVPVHEGRPGYPMVVPAGFDADGLDLAADDLLERAGERVRSFVTKNPVYVSGVDTAEDYRMLFRLG